MDSETRYHWRCLGWGPESWANGPNPPSMSVRAGLPRSPPISHALSLASGDSKSWRQLNAVERMSAEWLGDNEKRWEVSLSQFFACSVDLCDSLNRLEGRQRQPVSRRRRQRKQCLIFHRGCGSYLFCALLHDPRCIQVGRARSCYCDEPFST